MQVHVPSNVSNLTATHSPRRRFGLALTKLVILAAAVCGFSTQAARASITVHDLTQNTTTGVFTYTITLDSSASVQQNDGFVIQDFGGFTGATITGGLTTSEFTVSQNLTTNSLNDASTVNSAASLIRTINGLPADSATIEDISFAWNTPTPIVGATTATLTMDSSIMGKAASLSATAAIDHSGSPGGTVAITENTVSVPNIPVPEPTSVLLAVPVALLLLARRPSPVRA